MFTRLLASLVYTRLAPQSFYKEPNGPDRHYDGMWVPSLTPNAGGAHRRICDCQTT